MFDMDWQCPTCHGQGRVNRPWWVQPLLEELVGVMGVKRLAGSLAWPLSTTLRRLELAERRGFVRSVMDGRGRGWSRASEVEVAGRSYSNTSAGPSRPSSAALRELIERVEGGAELEQCPGAGDMQESDTYQDEVVEPYGEDYGKCPAR